MSNSIDECLLSSVLNLIEKYRVKQAIAATKHYADGMPSAKQLAIGIIRLVKEDKGCQSIS